MRFSLLSLPGDAGEGSPAGTPTRSFGGRQGTLALDLWWRQIRNRQAAYVYDLLGPARLQAWLPGSWRAPYLVPLYGIEAWRPLPWDRFEALANANVRLAISAFTAVRAREANPGLPEIDLLPLCLEERPPTGTVDGSLLDRVGEGYVLIVGRMAATERYKGHAQLLMAISQLRSRRPDLRLVIAGEGDDRPRLERLAAGLGLASPRVFFTGFVSEATLAHLYQRCAIFAMPSTGEGFGLVYLEAMQAGRPCLAARGSAAAEVVDDGVTGFLVDPLDPQAIADRLDRLLDEPELAQRLGEAGRRRFLTTFSRERFNARLSSHLATLTTCNPRHVRH
ncbi:MAG TPA: glycosyltransferase family 4 protein [Thermoanaerobaculia bacterium]|nr:glycosyltransferase family 4 protein [Thermoanaerobaculia bacterium]